ncbi:hypothetical protein POTOM_042097 [Populus tomentosa]|uniref:Disease resistance R13L4/SHOC-2-like LRR domain-containing protein n=1 Tax=Populus tomentosa TaxID=118781 RepID=A0A8X8CHX2_POPTO|nr:hypothetical protein POTOM_042097 [Populus tomentosa]
MEMVKGTIKEVGCFYGDRGNTEAYAVFSRWETELKNLFDDLDDHVDEFVIQMDQQQGSDRWHGRKDDIKEQSHGGKKFRQKLIRLPVKQRRKRMKVTENNLMETKKNYGIAKGRLIRLLVAEVTVLSPYRVFLRDSYRTAHPDSEFSIPRKARRILTPDMTKVAESLSNIQPRSLFLFGKQELSDENWLNFEGAKFLRVLDLEDAKIRRLPDEVGDLIDLAYLGLKNNELNEFPDRLGNLRALQSLDIRWCGDLTELSTAILKLVRLRHLKMFKSRNVSGMQLSGGIGTLGSLLTLTGVHAGGKIAGELRKLTQLRRLGMMDVAEENEDELYASIMVMQGLLSLSLEAKTLLTNVTLSSGIHSHRRLLLGNSALKVLPNLEKLTLWHAYDGRQLGKDFCKAGGFPKLEVLIIASRVLEEWTELEEGALPRLKYLHFHSCLNLMNLRMLPEGLQVTTVEEFWFAAFA